MFLCAYDGGFLAPKGAIDEFIFVDNGLFCPLGASYIRASVDAAC